MTDITKNSVDDSEIVVLPFGTILLLDALSGPDDKLGETLLAAYIQAKAENMGISVNEISEEIAQEIVECIKNLEVSTAKHAAFQNAVHKAARGDFETAGRFIREYLTEGADSMAWKSLGQRFVPVGIRRVEQVRDFGRLGGSEKKEQGQKNRKDILDTVPVIFISRNSRPSDRELAGLISKRIKISEHTIRTHLRKARPEIEALWVKSRKDKR